MARILRIELVGTLYNIIDWDIGRMMIFHSQKDWSRFLAFQEQVSFQRFTGISLSPLRLNGFLCVPL
jgi:hypothetical protein